MRSVRLRSALRLVVAVAVPACASVPAGPIMRDVPARRLATVLTQAEIEADLRFLATTVRRTAPEGAVPVSEPEVDAVVAREVARFQGGGTRRDVTPAAMRVAGIFRSGHVYVLLPHEDWNRDAAAGASVVTEPLTLSGDTLALADGRRVLTIGARETADFVAWYRDAFGTANPLRSDERFRGTASTALWLWGARGDVPFGVVSPGGATERVVPASTPMRPRRSIFAQARNTDTTEGARIGTSEGPAPGVVVVSAPTFEPRREAEWATVLRALDERIATGTVTHLVVDLRGNRGGTGRIGAQLLRVIAGRPLAQSGGKRWRRSPEYEAGIAAFVPAWLRWAPWRSRLLGSDGAAALDAIPMGGTATIGGDAQRADPPVAARVRTTILVDGGVASSATQFARAAQFHRVATLVGTPTSDGTSELGEIAFFRMPNSGLVFASPSAEFLDVGGTRLPGPVMPDLLVCASQRAAFAPGAALDAALGSRPETWRTVAAPVFRDDRRAQDYCAVRAR